MSVIIRLQNLPWSANALDIRQFFKGLAIPEGGVHIVGGELGDAFIAFSTDEDARQAMMNDRKSIKEVQVRLLLSSRAEMQKVIETARLHSISVMQQMAARAAAVSNLAPASSLTPNVTALGMKSQPQIMQNPMANASFSGALPTIDLTIKSSTPTLLGPAPSFLAYQQQAGLMINTDPIANAPIDLDSPKNGSKSDNSSSLIADRSNSAARRSSSEKGRDREQRRSASKDRRDGSRRYNRRDDHSRSRSLERERERERERGKERGRERDSKSRRIDRSRRSRSRDSRDRSSDRSRSSRGFNRSSRDRDRENSANNRNSKDSSWSANANISNESDKPKAPVISPWNIQPMNAYQTNQYQTTTVTNSYSTMPNKENMIGVGAASPAVSAAVVKTKAISQTSPEIIIPAFQNYTTSMSNNYSINNPFGAGSSSSNSSDSLKPFVLQNPYTTTAAANNTTTTNAAQVNTSSLANSAAALMTGIKQQNATNDIFSSTTTATAASASASAGNSFSSLEQEPIAFAKTNPYEQMYPTLFAQAAAQSMPRSSATAAQRTNSPVYRNNNNNNSNNSNPNSNEATSLPDSSSIRVSSMCGSTNYSDLRKFFSGLFIPHNGIKMVNDKHGLRIGVAFIQFSRQSSIPKALLRDGTMLKGKSIKIEVVSDEDFTKAEDSYRPSHRYDRHSYNDMDSSDRRYDGGGGSSGSHSGNDQSNPFKKNTVELKTPFNVLCVEELPSLTTELDIMRMFSSYTVYDILLMPSAENRREFVAHVKFSLADDAKAALEDKSKHVIGHRKVRVCPGKEEDMEKAKEKLRLANEQLIKEEELLKEAMMNDDDLDDDSETNNQHQDENTNNSNSASSSQPSAGGNRMSSRDPRLIPSLLEMPAAKPINSSSASDEKGSEQPSGPADPRLRTRSRPSRFDSDSKPNPTNNFSSLSDLINIMGAGGIPLPIDINSFNANNNSNSNNFDSMGNMGANNNFNDMSFQGNPMEDNFVFLYNCPYGARNKDIAEIFLSSNLQVKHVEMMSNDRGMPSGEFIVEVFNSIDAEIAVKDFHSKQFHGRSLRVRQIKPQEIADRLGKPFMNYIPGGGGNKAFNFNNNNNNINNNNNNNPLGIGGMMMNNRNNRDGPPNILAFNSNNNGNNNNNNSMNMRGTSGSGSPRRNARRGHSGGGGGGGSSSRSGSRSSRNNYSNNDDDDMSDDNGDANDDSGDKGNDSGRNTSIDSGNNNNRDSSNGIPEKFNRKDCVVVMENVPYKADSEDILRFFGDYNLRADDIIRRFNDEGAPTGDARVAFPRTSQARDACEKLNRKQIFNRTIYLSLL